MSAPPFHQFHQSQFSVVRDKSYSNNRFRMRSFLLVVLFLTVGLNTAEEFQGQTMGMNLGKSLKYRRCIKGLPTIMELLCGSRRFDSNQKDRNEMALYSNLTVEALKECCIRECTLEYMEQFCSILMPISENTFKDDGLLQPKSLYDLSVGKKYLL